MAEAREIPADGCFEGHERAFRRAFVRHYPAVRRLLAHVTRDRNEAEDLAQEVFVTLLHQRFEGGRDHDLRRWLMRVALNRGLNAIRSGQRREQRERGASSSAVYDLEAVVQTRETQRAVRAVLASLEPRAAQLLIVDDDGAAHVQQSAGAVFYRVDHGESFVVETPAGRATVTGTCFSLELQPMRNEIKMAASALAGAAATAAVLLTVQEGSVVLANDAGTVEAKAGQTAHAKAGSAPRLGDEETEPPTAASADQPKSEYARLVRENIEQRRALRQMQADLAATEGKAPAAADASPPDQDSPEIRRKVAQQCAVSGDCDENLWTDPSVDELRELAKCGRLLIDTPSFLLGDDPFPPGYVIEAAGLSESDAARYAEIAEALYKESGTQYAAFAHELGVPSELVDRLAPQQLRMLLEAVVDDWETTRHNVANERAQLSTPPAEQSAGERALRYEWGLGEEFERRLGAEFGTDAAAEMRRAAGGWANKSSWGGRECLD